MTLHRSLGLRMDPSNMYVDFNSPPGLYSELPAASLLPNGYPATTTDFGVVTSDTVKWYTLALPGTYTYATLPSASALPVIAGTVAWTSDAGNVVAQTNGTWRISFDKTFIPPTADSAGILAARTAAVAAGGGTVKLLPITYTLTQTIQITAKVKYIGSGYANAFQAGTGPTSGTILIGSSSIDAFSAKNTELVSWDAAFIEGFGVEDMAFSGFRRAINTGTTNAASLYKSTIRNIYAWNAADWGVFVENHEQCDFLLIETEGCGHGVYIGNSSATWNGGDSSCELIVVQSAGGSSSYKSRNILLGARNGSQLNSMQLKHCAGLGPYIGTIFSQTVTLASGNVSISVPELNRYAIGMPVIFTTSNNPGNFTSNAIYFIKTVSASSGAGTISIAQYDYTDPLTGVNASTAIMPNASLTATLATKGFPGIELAILSSNAQIFDSHLLQCAVENAGTALAMLQGASSCTIQKGNYAANSSTYNVSGFFAAVLRNCVNCEVSILAGGTIVDSDSAYMNNGWMDSTNNKTGKGITGFGIRGDGSGYNTGGIWLSGSRAAAEIRPVIGGEAFLMDNRQWKYDSYNYPSGASTMLVGNSPYQVYPSSAGGVGTWTLPAIDQYTDKLDIILMNFSAFNLTMNTSSSQGIHAAGAVATSIVVGPHSAAHLITMNDGGTRRLIKVS